VQALGADDIRTAARRYFNDQNYVQVVLNPDVATATAVASTVRTVAPGG